MRITVIFSTITISVWILGMLLDVIGLYIGVKFAEARKVTPSKLGYFTMRIGEIFESIAVEAMIFIPVIFLVEVLKIV